MEPSTSAPVAQLVGKRHGSTQPGVPSFAQKSRPKAACRRSDQRSVCGRACSSRGTDASQSASISRTVPVFLAGHHGAGDFLARAGLTRSCRMMDDSSESMRGGADRARYARDLYSWAVEKAELLRAGRIAEADALNIAEELDDVGNEQYDKLESALRIILLHLLKWEHQPRRRSRSWQLSILVQRKHVLRVLRKNRGLKSLVDEAITQAYDIARIEAAAQTLLEDDSFPLECPYSWNDIMERQISWPGED